MNEDKLLGMFGLAHRAGAVSAGAMQVEKALVSGKCKLLLIAADVAPETRKRLEILTDRTGTPVFVVLSKLQMGTAVGKSPKAALAVTDLGFAGAIRRMISSEG